MIIFVSVLMFICAFILFIYWMAYNQGLRHARGAVERYSRADAIEFINSLRQKPTWENFP